MGREQPHRGYGAPPESESLLPGSGESLFVAPERRAPKDVMWARVWFVVYLANIAAGVLTYLNRNKDFLTQISNDYLNDPKHCPADNQPHRRSLLGMRALEDGSDTWSAGDFLTHAMMWLAVSGVGALLMGLLFVWLVSRSPRLLLFVAIGAQVAPPLAAGGAGLMQGSLGAAAPFLILAGVLIFMFWLWREQLELVVRLLGVSGQGLRENLGLVGAAISISLGLLALNVPLLLTTLAALTNGHVVFNPERVDTHQCVGGDGNPVPCCAWQTDSHVGPVVSFTAFTLLWTAFIASQLKTFVVSGTIAQWYFAPVFADPKTTGGRVGRSMRLALGPSFGSLCFGALVLTVVELIRNSLNNLRNRAKDNILLYCLMVIFEYILSLVELVTKFATVRLAITGEDFMSAGRNVTDMLKRNFMNTFGVWFFPPMILQLSALILSGAWGVGVFCISSASYSNLKSGTAFAAIIAFVAFFLCVSVLLFFISLLVNVIDTVFICFGMDRDRHAVSRADIHAVYEQLPSVGKVIANPDGSYVYAAPSRPMEP